MFESLMHVAMGPAPAGGQGQGSPLQLPIMMVIMLGIFYFMLIRPQQRKEKERRAMLDNTKSGDRVVCAGGILGIVTNVKDKTIVIKVADNVKIEVLRSAITQILEKGDQPEEPSAK